MEAAVDACLDADEQTIERGIGPESVLGSFASAWTGTGGRTTLADLLHIAAIGECPFEKAPGTAGARWILLRPVGEVRYATSPRAGLSPQS
ncbi:hypothetical protein ACFV8T_34980 [Streptomyces sp. NPDC059832]|uniref:hypothetical protein n=1 Tax=unclassified Streptomyces TaxID=2593676 RepID=UPI0036669BCD